jgi:hypothetical protein
MTGAIMGSRISRTAYAWVIDAWDAQTMADGPDQEIPEQLKYCWVRALRQEWRQANRRFLGNELRMPAFALHAALHGQDIPKRQVPGNGPVGFVSIRAGALWDPTDAM